MSQTQNSLKPVVRRTPYRPFFHPLRGVGNYPWSGLQAVIVDADLEPLSYTPAVGRRVDIALFTQDVPVYLKATSSYAQSNFPGGTAFPPVDFPESDFVLASVIGASGADLLSVAPVAVGQESRIALSTGITVPAYAARLTPVARGLLNTGPAPYTADPCTLFVQAITESGVVAGSPLYTYDGGEGTESLSQLAVILPAGLYTQQIRDAHNVLETPLGVLTVVGLYDIVNPPN